jgi:glycosyltransferase involved in cell wall biosynthesis
MRLIFVNRFYWPDEPATAQLLHDLAEALAAGGIEVTVIASHPGDPAVPETEVRRGVRIVRVRSARGGETSLARKAFAFATYQVRALARLRAETRAGDCVVAMTDPPLFGIAAGWAARRRGARIVHWVQDIYPELAIALAGQAWLRLVRPLRDRAWRRADGCVTLGTDMAAVLRGAGVAADRLEIIPNWAPGDLPAPDTADVAAVRAEWDVQEKFVVAYSGNLGRVHDLGPVLDVAAAVRDPRIVFLFVGGGAQADPLARQAAARGLGNVRFRPRQPRDRLAASLAAADLHLVTLLPGCEAYVFPSKLYGAAAAGRPVLFVGPESCEVAALVRRHDFGLTLARDDVAAIAAAVERLAARPDEQLRLGLAARTFAATHTLGAAVARWRRLPALQLAGGGSGR